MTAGVAGQAERQREGAEINSSLMTLKACMRAALLAEAASAEAASAEASAGAPPVVRLPYRQHALTKLLKQSFEGGEGRTLLLATVSPSSAVRCPSIHPCIWVASVLCMDRPESEWAGIAV